VTTVVALAVAAEDRQAFSAKNPAPHKFTRLNHFSGLTALLRNFFATECELRLVLRSRVSPTSGRRNKAAGGPMGVCWNRRF
jgi:hypothetical protein